MNIKIMISGVCLWFLSAAAGYAGHGFFAFTWEPRHFDPPSYTQDGQTATASPDVTLTLNAREKIIQVLPTIFGNNTNAWIRSSINTDEEALRHLINANIHSLRLPGGNWSNVWLWDGQIHWGFKDNYRNDIRSRPTTNWSQTTDEMLELCAEIGAHPQICVNYALARYIDEENPVQKAAQYAADWVYDVNIVQGLNVEYWEIGNENYGRWQAGYEVGGVKITAQEYGRDCVEFIRAMKAVDPMIKVGVGLYERASGSNVKNWNRGVLPEVKDYADFLIIHDYFTWSQDLNDVTVQQVLDGADMIGEDIETVEAMVETYTGYPAGTYPIAMTEYNMRAGHKDSSFLSGMFIAEALGELIKHGYCLANLWDIANAYSADGGDHGMLSRNDPDVPDSTPHPSFYQFYYYDQCFGDMMIRAESSDPQVAVYASLFSNDYVGMVVVNEKPDPQTIKILPNGFPSEGSRMFRYELAADEITDFEFTINGEGPDEGKFGPVEYENIDPYLHQVEVHPLIEAAGNSINYLVIEKGAGSDVNSDVLRNFDLRLDVYPNPFNPAATVSFELEKSSDVNLMLFNVRGEKVGTLLSQTMHGGQHRIQLDGAGLASGLYFVQLEAGMQVVKKKVTLLQ